MKKHNVELIFVVSPIWYGKELSQFEALKSLRFICEKYNILFLNYYNSSKYVKNNKLFKDGSHLNSRGADEFTKELVEVLSHTYHIN
jgi:lysophospholipase L1-like esterase